MALVDTYRSNVVRKKGELAKLSEDKAKESKKIYEQQQKIISANRVLKSTKSQSTINSRLSEISRAESEIAKANSKMADIDKKMAAKEKEILNEEKKVRDEEAREQKKSINEEKRKMEANRHAMENINSTLYTFGRTQEEMHRAIVDLQKIPEKIKVLFMASNPTDSMPLRLDEEARAIHETISKSKHRDSVEFVTRWAMRTSDILQSINEANPDVIHFSGHGTSDDELVLQNTDGTAKLVKKEVIVQAISTVSDKVRLVFFNSCFSFGQAEAIVKHVEAAIGMTISIGDEAACIFAAQFYSSIGFGLTLKKSFEQAKAALLLADIPEENTPVLYVKEGLSADEIYIVRP